MKNHFLRILDIRVKSKGRCLIMTTIHFLSQLQHLKKNGHVIQIIGGDGIKRSKLTIPGWYRGKNGVFEFIKEPNGDINHRLFSPLNEAE